MSFEPLPRTRLEQVAGIQPPLRIRVQHYGRQVWQKLKEAQSRQLLKKIAYIGLALGVSGGIVIFGKAYERRQEREAEQAQETAKEAVRLTKKYVEDWKKSFLGELAFTCAEYVTSDRGYTQRCHTGPKGQIPTNVVTCNQMGCEIEPVK